MSMKERLIKKGLRNMGVDFSNPKQLVFRTINDLLKTSIPNLITKNEMVKFLNQKVDDLEKE